MCQINNEMPTNKSTSEQAFIKTYLFKKSTARFNLYMLKKSIFIKKNIYIYALTIKSIFIGIKKKSSKAVVPQPKSPIPKLSNLLHV